MKYVIIGNSAAAVGGIEAIRSVDTEGSVTLIAKEDEHTYSRPLISYYLGGEVAEKNIGYRKKSFYKDNHVDVLLGTTVVKIDAKMKKVVLDNGEALAYDRLLVATGSSPMLPPIKGLDSFADYYTFQSMQDAKALKKVLDKKKHVAILGGGLIGLKCAEGIGNKAASITVVDREPQILSSILDKEGAEYVQKSGEKAGVSFLLGENVVEIKEHSLLTQKGKSIPFDILVVAVGVSPNSDLIKEAGGDVREGIVVDRKNETTLKHIYAAGDCAESHDLTDDTDKVLALLPNAYIAGENAGRNMAGEDHHFDTAMAVNALKFWGKHLITAGIYQGEVWEKSNKEQYKKLYFAEDRLKGFMLIGNVEQAGIYTALIREKTPFSSIDFELIKEKPQLMAFSGAVRGEKLGGNYES